ncbi:MAG: hypothetical protein AAGA90_10005 [Actinomycetota bacterium]
MPRRQKLIFAAFVLAGLSMFVGAGLIGNSGNDDQSVLNNPAVDALIPGRGDEVLQQQTVGIDLAPGYRLVRLTISPDATCGFPVDVTAQTRYVEGLQQYLYTPGEGLPVRALSAEGNCAKAVFEEIANPGNTEEIDWSFTVS